MLKSCLNYSVWFCIKELFTLSVNFGVFRNFKKWVQCHPKLQDTKKIPGATDKNDVLYAKCEKGFGTI